MEGKKNDDIEKQSELLVYLVDDDSEDQEFFNEALEKVDMNIALNVFDCGKAVIDDLQSNNHKPDLIFLDLYMPFMDGEECLKYIRRYSVLDRIPIVIYSTEFDIDRIEQLMSLGANKYLRKPDSFDALTISMGIIFQSIKNSSIDNAIAINIVI